LENERKNDRHAAMNAEYLNSYKKNQLQILKYGIVFG
jgi:hypothetical protein